MDLGDDGEMFTSPVPYDSVSGGLKGLVLATTAASIAHLFSIKELDSQIITEVCSCGYLVGSTIYLGRHSIQNIRDFGWKYLISIRKSGLTKRDSCYTIANTVLPEALLFLNSIELGNETLLMKMYKTLFQQP